MIYIGIIIFCTGVIGADCRAFTVPAVFESETAYSTNIMLAAALSIEDGEHVEKLLCIPRPTPRNQG